MRNLALASLALLSVMLWSEDVRGQSSLSVPETLARNLSTAGGGSTLDRPASALSGIEVLAQRANSTATIKLSRTRSSSGCGMGSGSALFSTAYALLSAPLSKTTDDTYIFDLDGLTNAASVEAGFSRTTAMGCRNPFKVPELQKEEQRLCDLAYAAKDRKHGTTTTDKSQCDSALVQEYLTDAEFQAYTLLYFDPTTPQAWIWGASGKVGSEEFEYVDAATSTKLKTKEGPWSVNAFLSFVPSEHLAVYSVKAKYQRSYKGAKEGAVCPLPGVGATSVSCLTGPVGAPGALTKKLISLEGRWEVLSRGVGVLLSRDFESKINGIEVPVYLLKDKDGRLTGGVKAGWRSDTKTVGFGVFVGVPFALP